MRNNTGHRWKRAALAVGIAAMALLLCGLWLLLKREREPLPPPEPTVPTVPPPTEEPTLSGPDFFLPEHLEFARPLPVTGFYSGEGERLDLLERYPGCRLVLMYWGSWCPYCETQLEQLAQFQKIAEAAGNTRLILVNKTDAGKEETVQKAEQYLAEKGWLSYDHVYDVDLEAYRAYGMKRIPTTIVVDEEGYVRGMESSVLDAEGFAQLLETARFGNAKTQLQFLQSTMMSGEGGVYTSNRASGSASPQGQDVLSESMGLVMRCAVQLEDRALFDRCLSFVSSKMEQEGVFAWYVAADGSRGGANALLDDLRIARALSEANALWGGYDEPLRQLASAILEKNTYRGQLSSFYDFNQKKSGDSISLCYGDFAALDMLAALRPEYETYRNHLLQIVQGGYISDDFPLYYASFSYSKNRYSQEELNTAEALMTVYHLSEEGLVRQETLAWLKNALRTNTLAARYQTDGTAAAGYEYDSTAVFAIAALIGQASGDGEIYRLARNAMERSWVSDVQSAYFGAFTLDGTVQAFDQLLPMTVYVMGSKAKF